MTGRFTFVVDWNQGTYVSQVEANSVAEAKMKWTEVVIRDFEELRIRLNQSDRQEFLSETADADPVAVTGLRNVWCISVGIQDQLALVHIILTEKVSGLFTPK